jgi:hypothetical protein
MRLTQLGFAMALEPVPNFNQIDPHVFDSNQASPEDIGQSCAKLRTTASSHTAGRSAHTTGRLGTESSSSFIQRPVKRQRLDSPLANNMQLDSPSSRGAMPPPPKPISRMQSVRKIGSNLRKKFSSDRYQSTAHDASEGNGDVRMYDNGRWQNTGTDRRAECNDICDETLYMSGALPVEQSPRASVPQKSQLLGPQDNRSDFTFRASSPVKMDRQGNGHRSAHLPTEPSYIRLMDGLSSDSGVELELRDPRKRLNPDYRVDSDDRQVPYVYQNQDNLQGVDYEKRWNLGRPFMHQSPYGSSASVDVREYAPSHHHTNGYTNRAHNVPALSPTTPILRRQQYPGRQIESVVSPFFRNGHNQAQVYPSPGRAEPQDSSIHSGDYQYQRSRTNHPQSGWAEPRSLNALSFFDSPVNSRNEPIEVDHRRRLAESATTPLPRYQRRHLDSRGFITRPKTGRSPYTNDSAYGFSQTRTPYNRKAPIHSQAVIDVHSARQPPHSRIGHMPSTVPSIVTTRPSDRAQPQWENLQRAGVRSSRNAFGSVAGSNHAARSRNVFPGAGRRIVRR